MSKQTDINAILAAADSGGVIQASTMLELTQRGVLPNDPTLHTTMSVESALRAAGLSADEVEEILDR
ncbi:hypothetical protein ABXN37_22425 [Piscinibacter sakaiensis]|nr:hypothetical protein [Piscinibacter sakaiensis]